jgi:hypothetical protein
MNSTVKIGETSYQVRKLSEDHPPPCYAYELIGKRSTYKLMRNQNNPEMLFPIGKSMSSPRWWVRENEDGSLQEVRGVTVR